MKVCNLIPMLALLPTTFAFAFANCPLGANKCDTTNATVMLCGSHGWKAIEACYEAGACHIGPAGNAYCDKQVECTPTESRCDAANYVSQVCNRKGFWETDRKCAKPGCCESRNGKAACKAECGTGMEPPASHSTTDDLRDLPKLGDYCQTVNERYCDASYGCILKCGGNQRLFQEQCCAHDKKCYYDNASLEPSCG